MKVRVSRNDDRTRWTAEPASATMYKEPRGLPWQGGLGAEQRTKSAKSEPQDSSVEAKAQAATMVMSLQDCQT